jgi:hypothetical protein
MLTAGNITIVETLALLDGQFAALSQGISQGRYAFWLGSGISRDRIDDLKRMIRRLLVHLQMKIDPSDSDCRFRVALTAALELAQLSPDECAGVNVAAPVDDWSSLDTILNRLTREYSRLLDIRVWGEEPDYLLWDAVNLRATFAAADAEPDCEHLCLGILAIEGVAPDVASANWDGLIEIAVAQLTGGSDSILRVCVRAEDLREPRLRSRLIKFHGCAVRAAANPELYRPLIIARLSQITPWPTDPAFAATRDQLISLAYTSPTLMIGLSAQDANIQHIFALAQERMQWQWPGSLPAHVFAQDSIGGDQRNILKYVYREAYDRNGAAVEAGSLLRAFAKPLFVSLVLHVICAKLITLVTMINAPGLSQADRAALNHGLVYLRNRVAAKGDGDRLAFMRIVVAMISRALSIFREGRNPSPDSRQYRAVGATPVHQIANDPGTQTSGLGELAASIGLLGWGETEEVWSLALGSLDDVRAGALTIVAPGATSRMFFVANGEAALSLETEGVVSDDDGDAVIVHSTAPIPRQSRSPRVAPGRTGLRTPRHVDFRELLRSAAGINQLRDRFKEEAIV